MSAIGAAVALSTAGRRVKDRPEPMPGESYMSDTRD